MTLEQIGAWCMERANMKRTRDDFINRGRRTLHVVKFENGDSYEHEEESNDMNTEKYVKIKLNGVIDYAAKMEWHNFGWREVV